MNIILSIIYAPIVFFAMKYYDIKLVSLFIIIFSSIWLLLSIKKGIKQTLYPLFYLTFALFAFFAQKLILLKAMPVIISLAIALVFLHSYLKKSSIILPFLKRFKKRELYESEVAYIQSSTLFWVFVSFLNVSIHLYAFFSDNLAFWAFYGSIGGYGLIASAGLVQLLHKKFVFEKKEQTS